MPDMGPIKPFGEDWLTPLVNNIERFGIVRVHCDLCDDSFYSNGTELKVANAMEHIPSGVSIGEFIRAINRNLSRWVTSVDVTEDGWEREYTAPGHIEIIPPPEPDVEEFTFNEVISDESSSSDSSSSSQSSSSPSGSSAPSSAGSSEIASGSTAGGTCWHRWESTWDCDLLSSSGGSGSGGWGTVTHAEKRCVGDGETAPSPTTWTAKSGSACTYERWTQDVGNSCANAGTSSSSDGGECPEPSAPSEPASGEPSGCCGSPATCDNPCKDDGCCWSENSKATLDLELTYDTGSLGCPCSDVSTSYSIDLHFSSCNGALFATWSDSSDPSAGGAIDHVNCGGTDYYLHAQLSKGGGDWTAILTWDDPSSDFSGEGLVVLEVVVAGDCCGASGSGIAATTANCASDATATVDSIDITVSDNPCCQDSGGNCVEGRDTDCSGNCGSECDCDGTCDTALSSLSVDVPILKKCDGTSVAGDTVALERSTQDCGDSSVVSLYTGSYNDNKNGVSVIWSDFSQCYGLRIVDNTESEVLWFGCRGDKQGDYGYDNEDCATTRNDDVTAITVS